MSTQGFELQRAILMVNNRAYCVWDLDIKRNNDKFLADFDPEYYSYVAQAHSAAVGTDIASDLNLPEPRRRQELQAALSLRSAYTQGLETLFALICAAIQAPHCVPAWMLLYSLKDVPDLVKDINDGKNIPNVVGLDHVSWDTISALVHNPLELGSKDEGGLIRKGFAGLWRRFASEFLDETCQNEYNSIKHGLRVKAGGFTVAVGAQDEQGRPPSREQMRVLGSSEFGSGFFTYRKVGHLHRHLQLRRTSRNWAPEDIVAGLKFIAMSLQNVISFLQIFNHSSVESVVFSWPEHLQEFDSPWEKQVQMGVASMSGFGLDITSEHIEALTLDEMKALYSKGQVLGIRRFRVGSSSE